MAKQETKKSAVPPAKGAKGGKAVTGKSKDAAAGAQQFGGVEEKGPAPRLKARYAEEVAPALQAQFNYANVMQVPRVLKVVVNMGVGEALQDAKTLDHAVREMAMITGQKPLVTKATKSIAAFKLREGNPIGAKVTLRGPRMSRIQGGVPGQSPGRVRDEVPWPTTHDLGKAEVSVAAGAAGSGGAQPP